LSITETICEFWFTTYTRALLGLIIKNLGYSPTSIVSHWELEGLKAYT
jgi:hypothetical protein